MNHQVTNLVPCPRCDEGFQPVHVVIPQGGSYIDCRTCSVCDGTGLLDPEHPEATVAKVIETINGLSFDEQFVPQESLIYTSRIDDWDICHDAPPYNYDSPEFEDSWLDHSLPTCYRKDFWFLATQTIDDLEDFVNQSCLWSGWEMRCGLTSISVLPTWPDYDPFSED